MPVVVVQLWEGRSTEQKRALVRALTDAMVVHADASPEALHVLIEEYARENWGRGGVLADELGAHEKQPAVFRLDHLLLEVSDLERAEAFYVEMLGFSVRKRETRRDGRPLVVTEQGLGLTNGGGPGGTVEHLAFRSRDIAGLAERCRAAGVEIVDGPMETPYGISLYVRDPDGNKVELFGPA
ncbi:MAG: 2-hydroxymuconate tautomerase family protein [Gaiellaceae bacterium]